MKLIKEFGPFLKKDMIEILKDIPSAIIVGLLFALMVLMVYLFFKGVWNWKLSVVVFFLIGYVALVIEIAYLSRNPGSRIGLSLGLGDTWGATPRAQAYVIENILMYIPFGIIFPLLGKRASYWCIPVALGSSVLLEAAQWITQRGYCQLDDVVANTLGALIGVLVWALATRLPIGRKATYCGIPLETEGSVK